MNRFTSALVLLIALVGMTPKAFAVVLSVTPATQVVRVGDQVDVVIHYDDQNHLTLGGGFSMAYDPTAIEPVDYVYTADSDPQFSAVPIKGDGQLTDFTVGAFVGVPSGDIATISFRVLRDGEHTISMFPSTRAPLWPSAFDFGTFIEPAFVSGIIATIDTPTPVITVADEITGNTIFIGDATRIDVPVANTGNAALEITGVSLIAHQGGFAIVDNSCSGQTLAPASQCVIGVEYAVDALPVNGSNTARLTIDSNDPGQPEAEVLLRGVVASPKLRLSTTEFFDAWIGAPHRMYQVTVSNEGEWPASIDSVTQSVTIPNGWFEVVDDACTGAILGVGERCMLQLMIVAEEAGRGFTYLTVRHDNGSFAPLFQLYGYTPTPRFQVETDGPVEFDLPVGAIAKRRVTISNKSEGALELGVNENLASDAFTIVADTCSNSTLGDSESCFIDLQIQLNEPSLVSHWIRLPTSSLLVHRFETSRFLVRGQASPAR